MIRGNKRRKGYIVIVLMALVLTLSGCAQIISEEYKLVEVTIVDEEYHAMWL